MVTDYTQANEAPADFVRQKNLALPSTPDAAVRATVRGALKRHAFDSVYIQEMAQDHQKDLADFRKESETGQGPDLEAFTILAGA